MWRWYGFSRIALALIGCFVVLCILVASGVATPFDNHAVTWIGTQRSPISTQVMLFFTWLGHGVVLAVVGIGSCLILWRLKRPVCARLLLIGVLTAEVIYVLTKAGFRRPRPEILERLSSAGWYSFPSGHTMMGTVVWGLSLMLIATSVRQRWIRRLLLLLVVVVPCGIALSRVYLGVHYPSDVLGAGVLGVAWVLFWLDRSSALLTSASASIK